MPHYYFDTQDGGRDRDEEGVDLPDRSTAHFEAIKFAGACVSNDPSLVGTGHNFIVDLLDEGRQPILRVTISLSDLASELPSGPSTP